MPNEYEKYRGLIELMAYFYVGTKEFNELSPEERQADVCIAQELVHLLDRLEKVTIRARAEEALLIGICPVITEPQIEYRDEAEKLLVA